MESFILGAWLYLLICSIVAVGFIIGICPGVPFKAAPWRGYKVEAPAADVAGRPKLPHTSSNVTFARPTTTERLSDDTAESRDASFNEGGGFQCGGKAEAGRLSSPRDPSLPKVSDKSISGYAPEGADLHAGKDVLLTIDIMNPVTEGTLPSIAAGVDAC
jgi:hypothetical protein